MFDIICFDEEPYSFEKDMQTFFLYEFSANDNFVFAPSKEDVESYQKDKLTFFDCEFSDKPFDFSEQEELDREYQQMKIIFSLIFQLVGT